MESLRLCLRLILTGFYFNFVKVNMKKNVFTSEISFSFLIYILFIVQETLKNIPYCYNTVFTVVAQIGPKNEPCKNPNQQKMPNLK